MMNKESSQILYKKFLENMDSVNSNKLNFIGIHKRENIRLAILQWMKKYYSPRNTSTANEPEKAFTKIDIERLLNGRKDGMTPGFGSIDLFNNPQLRKKAKKLTSSDILGELEDIKKKYMPQRVKAKSIFDVQPKVVVPMKFTFKTKENDSDSNQ